MKLFEDEIYELVLLNVTSMTLILKILGSFYLF